MKTIKMVKVSDLRMHPSYAKIYAKKSLQFELLVDSIKRTAGLLEPIVINKKNEIINGVQRWLAAKELGFKTIPALTFDKASEDEVFYMINYNRYRTKTIVEKFHEIEEMKKYWGKRQGQRTDLQSGLSEVEKLTTRARIAATMNISEGNVYKIQKIAESKHELLALVDTHELSLNEAYEMAKGKGRDKKSVSNSAQEISLVPCKTCPTCGSVIKK
jgi:hypothetical protein